ncbi:TonB-dependent receptor plug domain-containing protein [Phenylobacterium deserti]|uniref:TonB-dependent receptor n=1 Tax=Phenylobacterium deserti TaxID=1914756 RepID=A0A328AUG9_9CAUL|nr:TonB-dependent receptor [Phenylobacterium deserti]RAK58267.1 TonB-dependent receptor [Phenylobacterium deserti]
MRSLLITSAAIAALLPAAALAEDAQVSEVVVTSTRLPSEVWEVTGARVIDRAELQARQSVFLTDVLTTLPGVGITRNGAFGGVSAIRIRGAGADKTLVLVDGVPVGDPADPNGAFDPSNVQASDERIELLSGPQGSLWGSEAIGGVVALTTREVDGLRLELEGGSFETVRGYAAAGVSEDAYALNGSVGGFRTDGISKAASGSEDDGYETFSANVGGRWRASDAVQLDGRIRYTESEIDIDGYPAPTYELGDTPDRNKSRAWSGFARATVDALGLTHAFSVSAYDLTRTNISDFPARYSAERQVWRWTAQKGEAADPLAFVAGAERQDTQADLDGRDSTDLSVTSVFGVLRARAGERLTLTSSLRYDDPDQFKSRGTGRLSAAFDAGAGFTVTASAGQGFKIPTISQVICDFCFAPPLALKPERAEGYDLRLGWGSDDGRFSGALTGYRLKVRDQISYRNSRYENIAQTRSSGLEAEASAQLATAWQVRLAYAWTDAIDVSTGASLLRVPDHAGSASLFYLEGPWEAALTFRAESSQSDTATDGFTPTVRDGFVTADLAGAYRLNDQITLTARVENLADRGYQETFGYGEPGRAVFVGVRLSR